MSRGLKLRHERSDIHILRAVVAEAEITVALALVFMRRVNEHHASNIVWVGVRIQAHIHATHGVPDQDVRPVDVGFQQQRIQLLHNLRAVTPNPTGMRVTIPKAGAIIRADLGGAGNLRLYVSPVA